LPKSAEPGSRGTASRQRTGLSILHLSISHPAALAIGVALARVSIVQLLERLVAATPTDDLVEFVQRAIGPLVEYDRTNGTDLVDTLAAWLETRNMAEASRQIHVHYNTFKNRLERIEAIIGPVLGDSVHTLECEIAIYIHHHYDVAWETRP
jgi:DNA-binding PucR family transcriptional regulator